MRTRRSFQPSVEWMPIRIAPSTIATSDPTDPGVPPCDPPPPIIDPTQPGTPPCD